MKLDTRKQLRERFDRNDTAIHGGRGYSELTNENGELAWGEAYILLAYMEMFALQVIATTCVSWWNTSTGCWRTVTMHEVLQTLTQVSRWQAGELRSTHRANGTCGLCIPA